MGSTELSIRVDEADEWHDAEEDRRAREVKFEKSVEKLKGLENLIFEPKRGPLLELSGGHWPTRGDS